MLYDWTGKAIDERLVKPPRPGRAVVHEAYDRELYSSVGRGLDPDTVDAIMRAADSGDTAEMCALAEAIDDRNFEVGAALDVRRAAIAATDWRLAAGDESPRGEEIAKAAEQMLRAVPGSDDGLLDFAGMVQMELGSALLPGFACPEIVWGKGGQEIAGFQPVEQKYFTFRNGARTPRLVTRDQPSGIDLPAAKFCLHWHRAKGGAAVRGGLIRACAWLHCFANVNYKDLLRFIERYGMPFLVAKVDDQSWQNERTVLKTVVQNFGPDGGAILSKNTELELLQAANNTGDIYFRLLEHLRAAAERLILGQTATSGEGGGWSNDGAQHLVRMDIRASDCAQIAPTVRSRILAHWTAWNYGPDAPVPRMEYDCKPPKDAKAEAEVVAILAGAGWDLDAEQVEASTGYKVVRRAPAPMPSYPPGMALEAEAVTATAQRQASPGAQRSVVAVDLPESVAESAAREGGAAVRPWLGPLQARLDAAAAIKDDAEFLAAVKALGDAGPELYKALDPSALEALVERTIVTAAAQAKAAEAERLARKDSPRRRDVRNVASVAS